MKKVQDSFHSAYNKQKHPLPNDVIEQVEKVIQGKNCTFTAFVAEAVRTALENLQDEKDD